MKITHSPFRLAPFVATACSAALALLLPALAGAAPVVATSADAFVDSIGVNVHAHSAYSDQHAMLKARLGELGVRHVRDGNHPQACRYAAEFFSELGIRTTFIMGRRVGGKEEWKSPLDLEKIDTELSDIKELALSAAAALEGPNEYDLHSDKRDPDWPATLRGYQKRFHAKAKADPALKDLPVIAPSLTSTKAYEAVGDLDAFIDRSCVHLYQSTRPPGTPGWGANGYGSIPWTMQFNVAKQSPAKKPTWSTECGYNNEISERGEAIYLPRMYAEFFRQGIERSFKYELMGEQWGLLRKDGSPRPAFTAIKNLIALLKDPGEPSTPASLDFELSGKTGDVRTLLLQKRSGAFFVVLWREVPSWDPDKKKDLSVPPAAVTFTSPAIARGTLHTLGDHGALTTSTLEISEGGTINLEIPDTLTVLELTR